MDTKQLTLWFSIFAAIGILWGVVFSLFGLGVVPLFDTDVLIPWGNGVYGATLMGFSVTLLLAGRHAFRKSDPSLMKALLYGISVWLIIEGLFSLYYRVWLNVGVDIGIFVLLGYPLIKGMRMSKSFSG